MLINSLHTSIFANQSIIIHNCYTTTGICPNERLHIKRIYGLISVFSFKTFTNYLFKLLTVK